MEWFPRVGSVTSKAVEAASLFRRLMERPVGRIETVRQHAAENPWQRWNETDVWADGAWDRRPTSRVRYTEVQKRYYEDVFE